MVSNNMITKDDVEKIIQANNILMIAENKHLTDALKQVANELKNNTQAVHALDMRLVRLETTINIQNKND